ncbi:MAG: glycosyltransferase family 2 protein [Butyrivibrio sp.]|nr:glycosyltransferase family 2 protein [Butyrivibrio sp.]
MLFSVIIPVCNGERYLRECIDSAMNQQINAGGMDIDALYEVIAVDNGSTDSTGQICDEYAERFGNFTVLHREAIGLYAARQVGISAARGEWILALDADDVLDKLMLDKLMRHITKMQKSGRPLDIVCFNASVLGGAGKAMFDHPFKEKVYSGPEKKAFFDVLCAGDSLNTMWTKCIRRKIAYLGREDLYLNFGEDQYQTAQYLDMAAGVSYLPGSLYFYRRNENSITAKFSEAYLPNQKIVWKKFDELVAKWNEEPEVLNRILERKALTCTIAVTKVIYSGLSFSDKKKHLSGITKDDFYRANYLNALPSWAPEESVYVHALQVGKRGDIRLLIQAAKSGVKAAVKRLLHK